MSYKIAFLRQVDKHIVIYKKSNPRIAKKIDDLLDELAEHPRTGTGHPEPLVEGSFIRYSRRISGNDRMIYDIFDDIVLVKIISVKGHYNDK
jgi:toxin YoeB